MYPSYNFLRPTIIFAAAITTLQSLAWITMSLIGIVTYYCQITPDLGNRLEGLLSLTMFQVYFRGECELSGLPEDFFQYLEGVQSLQPLDVHAWMWVYLSLSLLWLLTGLLMLVYVNKDNMKYANFYIYTWIFNTLIIAILDVVLGAFFARDYHNFSMEARKYVLEAETSNIAALLMARGAAWILLAVSMRGFLLWIINVALVGCLMFHTFAIYDHNKVKSGFSNNAFVEERERPISGYDPFTPKPWYSSTNEIPRVKTNSLSNNQRVPFGTINVFQTNADIKRPASVNQNRPDPYKERSRSNNIPRPDYSPQVPRSLRLQNDLGGEQRGGNRGLRRYNYA